MSEELGLSRYTFGLHEPGGEYLMEEKGRTGWIVFTHALGRDPDNYAGVDYRSWSDRGFGIIARLNHGYGAAGTIPQPQYYHDFAQRVRNWVAASPGCRIWIIGNEMNHGQERPDGEVITPYMYALCYKLCRSQIHCLPGHEEDEVVMGAVAPWNNTTTYPGNETGDWILYFQHIIRSIRLQGSSVDAIALHTYTHGHDPALVFSEQKMSPPFQDRHFNFRAYQDFVSAIPVDMRTLPVYITETNQNLPWEDANRGWVQNAYLEIDNWNSTSDSQKIRALALYRWPKYDQWYIDGKTGVHADFQTAMDYEYAWEEADPSRLINGHWVQGGFLEFFNQVGLELCGLPISDEVTENGLQTQYFEQLILQEDLSGAVSPADAGAQVLALRDEVEAQQTEIDDLEEKLAACREGRDEAPGRILRPAVENIVKTLIRHPTKRYDVRSLDDIRYLTISHSAVPSTVTARQIARFHVNQMGWPGIGYHFYLDDKGQIHQTNELAAVCYHVGQWDAVSVAICIGGNFAQEIPNDAQMQSTAHLVAWLLQELGLPQDAVVGKSELVDTQSPGLQWLSGKRWKDLLLAEVEWIQNESPR
jgi:hypothetical protein